MEGGVILFADDQVFEESFEKKFFQSLLNEKRYPVLAIHSIELLEKTVRSISTCKALILDWNFERVKEIEDEIELEIPNDNPGSFLLNNDIFSLIYIYSDKEIDKTDIGRQLSIKYGSKIKFKKKDYSKENVEESANAEKAIILEGINQFELANSSLAVPYLWSQSINRSTQEIFRELEIADPNWVKDIYKTAEADGGEPVSEVIGVFQHLLGESIIQNATLKQKIAAQATQPDITVENKETSLAKLYNRLFYTKLTLDAPIMTGDIFIFDEIVSGILITPECDVNDKKTSILDFLMIDRKGFDDYLKKQRQYEKADFEKLKSKEKRIPAIIRAFNQDEMKYHALPSFPFDERVFNETALIDFSTALVQVKVVEFGGKRGKYKLNPPYIHQLRQRYLSYVGRIGVPSIPESLRIYNIK